MEKKKILEGVKSRPKDTPLLSTTFLKDREDPSTAVLFELFDRMIILYTTTTHAETYRKISFDFDLVFELVRGAIDDEVKKRTGPAFALKF